MIAIIGNVHASRSACIALLLLAACSDPDSTPDAPAQPTVATDFATTASCDPVPDAAIRIAGTTFTMGQMDIYPAEEGPLRQTTIDSFWLDPHEVTNRQFAAFVAATGYVMGAELPVDPAAYGVPADQIPPDLLLPGFAVFTPPERPSNSYTDWWVYVPGASWKKPYGPQGPDAVGNQPVVHLAYADMQAYADRAEGRLPTEAEWEYAAVSGAAPASGQPGGDAVNSWQGVFPMHHEKTDGFSGIAPVGCVFCNYNGMYDIVRNMWEVVSDFYRPGHDPADRQNPRGPSENAAYDPANPVGPSRVMKGGSYLCAPNYCQRYRPAARQGRDPGLGASNVGFRLAYDTRPGA